jgi:hypothetical protein
MSEPVEAVLVTDEGEPLVPVVRTATMVRAAPGDVIEAFREYQQIQQALDKQLPNSIQEIRGKRFRKKNYWRAIATAFNLTVEERREERRDDAEDWGYLVTYRAIAPNGRYADGDGSCFATEKASGQDTLHNVRSHAHTRAFNRAVSNLVGFGEVSAEEVEREERPARSRAAAAPPPPPQMPQGAPPWFGEPLGFGKHKLRTWQDMTCGSVGGERHQYLEYLRDKIVETEGSGKPLSERDTRLKARVAACLLWISNREDRMASEGGNADGAF